MSKPAKHKWTFPARFRTGAYSWQATRLACQRLREAVSEIKKVAKKDPVLGAEGAVVWRHDSRQVVFLGDFIDRGPGQQE